MNGGIVLVQSLVGAGTMSAWAAPAIILVLLIVAASLGVRWVRSEHLEALRAVPLFSLLPDRELTTVLRSAQAVGFEPGSKVTEQGGQDKGLFVVTEGTATVSRDGAELATLGAGSYFGEMAVIDGGPRTATVTAKTQLSTLEISPSAFRHLLDREPMIAKSVYEEFSRRLKATGSAVEGGADARVDRARLVELCTMLRSSQDLDWAVAPTSGRGRLRFSKLVARGSST